MRQLADAEHVTKVPAGVKGLDSKGRAKRVEPAKREADLDRDAQAPDQAAVEARNPESIGSGPSAERVNA